MEKLYRGFVIKPAGYFGKYGFDVFKDNDLIGSSLFNDDKMWSEHESIPAGERSIDEWIERGAARHSYFRESYNDFIKNKMD